MPYGQGIIKCPDHRIIIIQYMYLRIPLICPCKVLHTYMHTYIMVLFEKHEQYCVQYINKNKIIKNFYTLNMIPQLMSPTVGTSRTVTIRSTTATVPITACAPLKHWMLASIYHFCECICWFKHNKIIKKDYTNWFHRTLYVNLI